MSSQAIVTRGLTKRYGPTVGISELDLTVQQGEVFGFLGPNGAGKTTTIRLLMDLIRPTSGSATVLGMDCQEDSIDVRGRVGYLPGELELWPQATGRETIEHLASLRNRPLREDRLAALADRLGADLDVPAGDLSRGNKQKIGLIQAFVPDPDVLVLDEPTTGLDPINQRVVLELVDEARAEGKTVFFSSHILPEVQRACDRAGIVREGKLVAVENVDDLLERGARRFEIQFAAPAPRAALADVQGVRDLAVDGHHAALTFEGPLDPLIKQLAEHTVLDVRRHEGDLAEVFMAYYEDEKRPRTSTMATDSPSQQAEADRGSDAQDAGARMDAASDDLGEDT